MADALALASRRRLALQRTRFEAWTRRAAAALRLGPLTDHWPAPASRVAVLDAAARDVAIRLALAMGRERLVPAHLGGGALTLELEEARVEVPLRRERAFELHAPGSVLTGDPLLGHPEGLLLMLARAVDLPRGDLARVRAELEDAVLNLALARLAAPMRSRALALGLAHLDPRLHDPEHFVIEGHPWHPMAKTRLGLRLREHLRHAPELLAQAHISVLELPAPLTRASERWDARMEPLLGRPSLGARRLPVHPAQLPRLGRELPPEVFRQLRVLPAPPLRGRSLLSLRTVALDAHRLHLKLATGIHTTSALRVVSPMSVHNGPRVSRLLEQIQQRDPATRSLRVMAEHTTAGLEPEVAGPEARQLGAIVREAPWDPLEPEVGGWVCAALGERRPGSTHTLLELATAGYPGGHVERLERGMERYVELLVPPTLRLLSVHGVALEVHLQNVRLCVQDGRPAGFIVRDLGGIRLHAPALRRAGLDPELDPASFIVTEDLDEVIDKLSHALFHAHLAALFGWAAELGVPSGPRWAHVARVVDRVLSAIAADPQLDDVTRSSATRCRDRLLAPRCRAKALLRMRLGARSSDYDYVEVDNALYTGTRHADHV